MACVLGAEGAVEGPGVDEPDSLRRAAAGKAGLTRHADRQEAADEAVGGARFRRTKYILSTDPTRTR